MTVFRDNFFFPQLALCIVWRFAQGHNHMDVNVSYSDNGMMLTFYNVQYFSGPFVWQASSIIRGNDEDCRQIMTQSLLARDNDLGNLKLFKIGTNEFEVKIIANELKLKATSPPNKA